MRDPIYFAPDGNQGVPDPPPPPEPKPEGYRVQIPPKGPAPSKKPASSKSPKKS